MNTWLYHDIVYVLFSFGIFGRNICVIHVKYPLGGCWGTVDDFRLVLGHPKVATLVGTLGRKFQVV